MSHTESISRNNSSTIQLQDPRLNTYLPTSQPTDRRSLCILLMTFTDTGLLNAHCVPTVGNLDVKGLNPREWDGRLCSMHEIRNIHNLLIRKATDNALKQTININ
jgi:hypothetical protein